MILRKSSDGSDEEFEDIDELNDVQLDHGNIVKFFRISFTQFFFL